MAEYTVKVLQHLDKGKIKILGSDGKARDMFKDKGLLTALEVGQDYKIGVDQRESKAGFKYNVIVSAELVKSAGTSTYTSAVKTNISTPYTPKSSYEPKTVTSDPDKMTKGDWAKKDLDIKWLACIKSSADFHSRRPESTIEDVIVDAKDLFKADYTKENLPIIEPESEVL